jgi:hypothetical protein
MQPERVDVAKCTGLPVTLVFLPAADIAAYVGTCVLAIFRGNFRIFSHDSNRLRARQAGSRPRLLGRNNSLT